MGESPQKIAKDLAHKIAFLNRLIFNNIIIPVYVVPESNHEWKDQEGVVAYEEKSDLYVVLTQNIMKLSNISESGLFGTAAHEVRHRFQNKNPQSVLSQEFLVQEGFITNDAIAKIIEKNKKIPTQDFKKELDSMVIEELVRKTCFGLSLLEILQEAKIDELFSIITCTHDNFPQIYLNAHKL